MSTFTDIPDVDITYHYKAITIRSSVYNYTCMEHVGIGGCNQKGVGADAN